MSRLLACLMLLTVLPIHAGTGARPCAPSIERGWVRMAPGMPMGAGFAIIRNRCAEDVEVIGASSPAFGDVSLHESRVDDGVSRMRALPAVRVPAGTAIEMKPGGMHVMLARPRGEGPVGPRVRVEFLLRDGRRIGADLPVRMTAP